MVQSRKLLLRAINSVCAEQQHDDAQKKENESVDFRSIRSFSRAFVCIVVFSSSCARKTKNRIEDFSLHLTHSVFPCAFVCVDLLFFSAIKERIWERGLSLRTVCLIMRKRKESEYFI